MNIDSPISEIAKLAKNKGFKAKTVSTIHTFEYFTNNGKNFKINDTCLFLLACEIQTWLRQTHGIKLWCIPHPFSSSGGWCYNILAYKEGLVTILIGEKASTTNLTYEQALEEGLPIALKHI
jgi:hypothetical protein